MTTPALGTILVHVDDGPDARARTELASDLAVRTGASLIGIASAQPVIPVYAPFADGLVTIQPEVMKAAEAQIARTVGDAQAVFDDIVGGRKDVTWRSSSSLAAGEFVLRQTRAADLIVLGRRGGSDSPDPILGVVPADVIMGAGRPVLVTPPGTQHLFAKRVVIAWKDAREARRAVADALPLLRLAEDVFVVSVGPEADQDSAADVAAALGRCGVNARALVEDIGNARAGDALIEIARRAGADLIVSGAFGHSRMREWVFGGVTRDLLDHAPFCSLFSH
jgi:nucleotide-binding universal stress UspA family protein